MLYSVEGGLWPGGAGVVLLSLRLRCAGQVAAALLLQLLHWPGLRLGLHLQQEVHQWLYLARVFSWLGV